MAGQTLAERAAKKGWVTPKDAAEQSGFSAPTIYRWIKEGELASERVAGRMFVQLSALRKKLGSLGKQLLEQQ